MLVVFGLVALLANLFTSFPIICIGRSIAVASIVPILGLANEMGEPGQVHETKPGQAQGMLV